MYVAESFAMEDILVNNSAILYHPLNCSDCVVEFYCLSNSTLCDVGEVVLPDGTTTHSSEMQPSVERLSFCSISTVEKCEGGGEMVVWRWEMRYIICDIIYCHSLQIYA